MRALKIATIVMGLLLVVGFWVLGVSLYERANTIDPVTKDPLTPIELPLEGKVLKVIVLGSKLVLHFEAANGNHEFITFDPLTGSIIAKTIIKRQISKG